MTIDFDNAPGQLRWRCALYGGLFGSVGASMGWLCWLTAGAFVRRPGTILGGAVLSILFAKLLELLERYIKSAVRGGDIVDEKRKEASVWPFLKNLPRLQWMASSRSIAVALVALGLISKGILGASFKEAWIPLIVSISVFFPAGAVLEWCFSTKVLRGIVREAGDLLGKGQFTVIVYLIPLACAVGLATSVATLLPYIAGSWIIGSSRTDSLIIFAAVAGWWIFTSFTCLIASAVSDSKLRLTLGIGLMTLLTALFAVAPNLDFWMVSAFRPLVNISLIAPELPAVYWADATRRIEEQATQDPSFKKPFPALKTTTSKPGKLYSWLQCSCLSGDPSDFGDTPAGRLRANMLDKSFIQRRICDQLSDRTPPQLIRSWLVLLFFSLGLSVAAPIEQRLRPSNYESSNLRRYDRRVLFALFALEFGVIVAASIERATAQPPVHDVVEDAIRQHIYDVVDLGEASPGDTLIPLAINRRGVIVGYTGASNRGFVRSPGGMVALVDDFQKDEYNAALQRFNEDLESVTSRMSPDEAQRFRESFYRSSRPDPANFTYRSTLNDINDADVTIGNFTARDGTQIAFVYSNGELRRLSKPKEELTEREKRMGEHRYANIQASRITNRGLILGTIQNSRGELSVESSYPVQWHLASDDAPKALDVPVGWFGDFQDINNDEVAVGTTYSSPNYHAVTFKNDRFTSLPLRGAEASEARAINDRSDVVGEVSDATRERQACLWKGNELILLGTLGFASSAEAINDREQIVGWSDTEEGIVDEYAPQSVRDASKYPHAFLYQEGKLMDLNAAIPASSEWILRSANAINDAGEIIGTGVHKGRWSGFIVRPVR